MSNNTPNLSRQLSRREHLVETTQDSQIELIEEQLGRVVGGVLKKIPGTMKWSDVSL